MPNALQCPDPETLQRFLLGQDPPEEAEAIEAHLEACTPCTASLQTLNADDSMVLAMRARRDAATETMNEGARLLADWLKKLRPDATEAVSSTPSATITVPSVLGPYQLRKVLGSGGMGIVFEAFDPQLDRLVAIKTLLPTQAANPSAKQRFLREAKAAAAIKHDHIVDIYQVGEDREIAFLAMELLEGETLDQRLGRVGRLPLAETLRIARECADVLSAAHDKGLIHRDVKPANIWLEGSSARVKLLDFGLARAEDDTAHLTLSGAIVGTPAFMAPEQLRGEAVDARADLFSLGCVLYRMATGTAPFKAAHPISSLIAIATTEPRAPEELNPELPRPLCELIRSMLAKAPEGRPPTARAVVAALGAIELGSSPKASRAPAIAMRRTAWRIQVGTAALAICLLGGMAYRFWPTQTETSLAPPDSAAQEAQADRAAQAVSWTSSSSDHALYKDAAHALGEILDFRQIVGASSAQLKDWHEKLDPKFRVSHVYSRKGNGPVLFDVIAVRETNPVLSRFHLELTGEAWLEKRQELETKDRFRQLVMCNNLSAGQKHPWYSTALWVKDGQKPSECAYGWMENVTSCIESYKAEYRPIYLAGTESPDGLGCNTIVAPDQGRKWEVFYALNHDEVLSTIDFFRRKGWRPDVIAPYWQGEELKSMLVAVDNSDKVDWRYRMNMSRADYLDETDRQKRRGLFPLALASYGHDDAVRYAAIFVRYRR